MKKISLLAIAILSIISTSCNKQESLSDLIERGLNVSTQQSLLLAKEIESQEDRLPRTFQDGELKTTNYRGWISGFFPGTLWYLYENTPTEELKKYAELYTARVEPAKNITSTHDLGFMLYCSFGNGYRLTENEHYLDVLKTGAESLATRYNDTVKAMMSWNPNDEWQFPVIIDNMMNLEFLMSISKKSGDEKYGNISNKHAQTTMTNHFRPDYSTFHVVSYDTITGQPHVKQTHQGFADESAWARGQAWALYGYTMMYRETSKPEYLEQACKIAHYINNQPNMPADKVPYWDFHASNIPNALRDASSAAIMASAFVELSQLDKSKDADTWLKLAEEQIRSLSSPEYLAEVGTNGGFILKHSVGNLNKDEEVDVPLTYADYYYIEALLRLKKLLKDKDL